MMQGVWSPKPPSASALLAKLGCTSLGTDSNAIATNYTIAYIQTGYLKGEPGSSNTLCPATDVATFQSSSNQNKWLALQAAESPRPAA